MTQIKIFINTRQDANYQEELEKEVNGFLKENDGKIMVKDIKYTSNEINPHNPLWRNWSVMVIYDMIK